MRFPAPGDAGYLQNNDLRSVQMRRIRRILLACGWLLGGISCFWGAYFGLIGRWEIVALDLLLLAVGIVVVLLARRHRLRVAALILISILYVNLIGMAAVYDIPSTEVPRSAHLYLLVLAIGSYLLLQHEQAWLRYGVPLVCLLSVLLFASSNWGLVTPYALPDSVRAGGTWVNNSLALFCIAVLMFLMEADLTTHTALASDLRRALEERQFQLHYQPQIDQDGRVIGAEALIRWLHPTRGMVSPGEFIPTAEQTDLILPMGQWVLETAGHQLARWAAQPALADLVLSINVSARQFHQPNFMAQVLAVVTHNAIAPGRLKIELTESMLVRDIEEVIAKMSQLKAHGVGFSLDDFGTGFSSLSYLKRLPLDQLKIDQSFVRDVLSDGHDAAIARTVISLGQSLGLTVIAEGVETQGQRDFLAYNRCHAFQGYLFSRPLPLAQFDAFVTARSIVPASQAKAH